jgi:hypothetical protein
MVSRGPDPSLTQLKVMVAWSPDELALTYILYTLRIEVPSKDQYEYGNDHGTLRFA